MKNNDIHAIIETTKEEYGFRPDIHVSHEDDRTIGYGFNLESGITREEAEAILKIRVRSLVLSVESRLKYPYLPTEALQVLVMLAYQLGVNGVFKFRKTLRYMYVGEWGNAADEMLNTEWGRTYPDRAQRLSDLVREIGL